MGRFASETCTDPIAWEPPKQFKGCLLLVQVTSNHISAAVAKALRQNQFQSHIRDISKSAYETIFQPQCENLSKSSALVWCLLIGLEGLGSPDLTYLLVKQNSSSKVVDKDMEPWVEGSVICGVLSWIARTSLASVLFSGPDYTRPVPHWTLQQEKRADPLTVRKDGPTPHRGPRRTDLDGMDIVELIRPLNYGGNERLWIHFGLRKIQFDPGGPPEKSLMTEDDPDNPTPLSNSVAAFSKFYIQNRFKVTG
ncbi:hypothetical protein STEG23_027938 [Scotinomys teguina]